MKIMGNILYRIYYDDRIVYVGRTNRPLHDRIRGHVYGRPMHRKIDINQVSKIEYASFKTKADMYLYEIYFINTLHPALNVDDKSQDSPTIVLPEVEWLEFKTHLWEKWKEDLNVKISDWSRKLIRYSQIPEEKAIIKAKRRSGEIDDDECYALLESLEEERSDLHRILYK